MNAISLFLGVVSILITIWFSMKSERDFNKFKSLFNEFYKKTTEFKLLQNKVFLYHILNQNKQLYLSMIVELAEDKENFDFNLIEHIDDQKKVIPIKESVSCFPVGSLHDPFSPVELINENGNFSNGFVFKITESSLNLEDSEVLIRAEGDEIFLYTSIYPLNKFKIDPVFSYGLKSHKAIESIGDLTKYPLIKKMFDEVSDEK